MSFTDAVRTVLSKYAVWQAKYAVWQGRASRAEYWWWALAYGATVFVLSMLGAATNSAAFSVLMVIVMLGGLLPAISVTVRRLHDTGRSGAWYWIALVPLVGAIILLVFLLLPSDEGANGYGAPSAVALAHA